MSKNSLSIQSDKAGITSALLCMAHCLVVPVAFLAKTWYTDSSLVNTLPSWWEKLDYIFLVISFLAVYYSAGHTKYREIKTALWTFWALLATAIISDSFLHWHWLAYFASAGLIITHFMNIRRVRKNEPVRREIIDMATVQD